MKLPQNIRIRTYNKRSGLIMFQQAKKRKYFMMAMPHHGRQRKNVIAFNQVGTINISDLSRFFNIAVGVYGYTWLPDGSGFLLSSAGTLQPDGWTSAILFTKKVRKNYKDVVLFGGVDHFFTLPREIGTNRRITKSLRFT